ncbi:hypothetical protein M569_17724 [Genlisea aurea]|uniref:Uncharacterized protein n=1 Tax=Genlisea aurea TaxID=192259 RepID=S8BR41_9LAMI|nr:hypothetical protein M569_17724 [Genlisea aurea]
MTGLLPPKRMRDMKDKQISLQNMHQIEVHPPDPEGAALQLYRYAPSLFCQGEGKPRTTHMHKDVEVSLWLFCQAQGVLGSHI